MIRLAIDTDTLADLPVGLAPLLLTYSDLVPTLGALRDLEAKHVGSQIILMDRGLGDPTHLATIADVEPEALAPADLPAWFDAKTNAGLAFLTVYSDRDDLAACDAALAGTPYANHWRMVATLDGTCFVDGMEPLRRPAVVQILDDVMVGIHADLSLVINDNWHPAP